MTEKGSKPHQTLDQRRAAHAWRVVDEAAREEGAADFRRAAKKLPAQIVNAGLGQALVVLHAKKRAKHLEEALSHWILAERNLGSDTSKGLLEAIVQGDSNFLRAATEECLLYLQWLNRFAEAEIKDEGEEP